MQNALANPYFKINSVAVIGNYLPRQCGIATFTTDLVQALSSETTDRTCWAVAMNDKPEGYAYPGEVKFEINEKQLDEYRLAAEFLNINQADVVCLQHEYGIFGGPAGSHILKLLAELRIPVVTTLHTVLTEPSENYRKVMLRLAELSDRLVVMSHKARDILQGIYGIEGAKIAYIPHGIPDMPFVDPSYYKDQFGVLGKKVLLTFGLLSENKGIEYALEALPKVVERFPEAVYIVLGATHPHVLQTEGESYRLQLQQLVRNLNLEQQVIFQNRFVTLEELCEYLAAADVYITPYIGEAQITSGTLAYAMGTGKPVVSTPYWYAQEMLEDGRGHVVPFKDPESLSEVLIRLLGDDTERHLLRKRA
jgi:glycosyltransferase involved in cell wall biosynthesis